ncbi:MAG TPA: hypothetical protein VK860_12595, partial [Ilumatobacteraceae bacterium]|nr:hypothetical protein [Ilumatobacteraceae bacterium]
MKLNPLRRSKALLGLALVASSVAAVVPLSTVAQAAPGDAPAGPATISPASGPLTGTFTLSLPVGASCPGDGPAGYRWGTYITPITNDVGGMVFDGLGSPSGQPAFTSSLRQSPGGGFLRGQTPGLTNGLIPVPIPTLQWLGVAPPAGEYNIGIACTLNDGTAIVNTRFWNAQITVAEPTPGNFTFATGVAPAAPVLTAGVGTASTQTINIAQTGTVDSYSLSVTPPLPSLPTVAPGATSFELTGLTLGQSYDVVLTANKSGFPGAASNTLSFTAAATGTIAVEAPNAFEGTDATISWSAPTFAPGVTAPAPLSYDVAISGGPSF